MEAFNQYFLTLIIALFLILIPQTHSTTSSYKTPSTYTNFIKQSCNTTSYPSLCTQTLTPYASKVKTNPLQLCKTALAVAIDSSRNCSAAVSKFAGHLTRRESRAVKNCIADLKDAVYELKQTLSAMGRMKDADREFEWANAKTYASAAITDAETCVDEVAVVNKEVKKKIKGCAYGVEKHISNALALINHLY